MQNNVNTNVERIIAKIDNDFNPDNSDWIPRVGAWCIDAMNIIDVLPTKRIKKKFKVTDRIAHSTFPLTSKHIKIYDCNGCEIKEATDAKSCCGEQNNNDVHSTGEVIRSGTSNTTVFVDNDNINELITARAETINDKDYTKRHNVVEYYKKEICEHNYVIVDNSKIELNFDTDCIIIEYDGIETTCSEVYGCELPAIPNNGKLIEAIVYYCMYKMLCRGYKHPVFNLNASQYGTNPYYIWLQYKDEAYASVINNNINDDSYSQLMRSNFFISTFDSRR